MSRKYSQVISELHTHRVEERESLHDRERESVELEKRVKHKKDKNATANALSVLVWATDFVKHVIRDYFSKKLKLKAAYLLVERLVEIQL